MLSGWRNRMFFLPQKRLRPKDFFWALGRYPPWNKQQVEHLKNGWEKVQMIHFPFGILFTLFSGANLLLVLGEWEVYFPEGWWRNHWWNQSLMKLDTEHQGSTLAEQNPKNPWSRWWQLKYFLFSPWTLGFHDPIWFFAYFFKLD